MKEADWEIASHGLKWIDYKDYSEEAERDHLMEAIRIHEEVTGARPLGIYTGRSSVHSIKLTAEEGGFVYCSDVYSDDLPYWIDSPHGPFLLIPYTLDANDMRFASPQGSTPATSSSPISRTASTISGRRARRARPR